MSKRPRKESHEDDAEMRRRGCSPSPSPRTPKPLVRGLVPWSHSANSQRYLYLVLDDWQRGYSIHRLGEDDFKSDAGLDARAAECPLVRVQAQHAYTCSFADHGSKILAMQPAGFSPGIPVFDTETLEMTVYPFPKSRAVTGTSKLVHTSVGDRLVLFVFRYLEVLGPEPQPPVVESSWSWSSPVEPFSPFDSSRVSSYALHPDGRTIFMSVEDWRSVKPTSLAKRKRNSTYTLDTERLEWTRLGDWLLPFKGRAHYDRELDAWVGICLFEEGAGHLCCCDVPPAAGCRTMPAWKFGKDLLFDAASIRHWGVTLVYMGDSRFCLIESRVAEDYDSDQRLRVLTMTSFGLKYDKVGELVTSQYRAYASMSYHTTHIQPGHRLDPVAFWM